MKWNDLPGLSIVILCIAVAPALGQGIPDLDRSVATMERHTLPGHLVLMSLPDGSGNPFAQAVSDHDHSVQNATISLLLLYGDKPIPNFPRQDMWLETWNAGLVACIGGTIADFNTDADGLTEWAEALRAGGWDGGDPDVVTLVLVSGYPLPDGEVPLWHNSPDINGDGLVNVTDIQEFSVDYFAFAANPDDYEFRSDLEYDGEINVADIVPLAQGQGRHCP